MKDSLFFRRTFCFKGANWSNVVLNPRWNFRIYSQFKIPRFPVYNLAKPSQSLTQLLFIVFSIDKRGKGLQTQNCPNSSFSDNFSHCLSEKIWKIKCSILQLLVLHQIEAMQLSFSQYFAMVIHNLNNRKNQNSFWNDKKVIWYG